MIDKEITTMQLNESGEDYLVAIYEMIKQRKTIRSVDLVNYFNYSRPSISRAVHALNDGDYIKIHENHTITLTANGRAVAEQIYQRRYFFTELLIQSGIDPKVAKEEASKMEHTLTFESFKKLKYYLEQAVLR